MLFFSKKKEKEEKKLEEKPAKVDSEKKPVVKKDSEEKKEAVEKKAESKKKSMKDLYKEDGGRGKKIKKSQEEPRIKKETKKTVIETDAYRILVRPLITEKASVMGSQNKYVFVVNTQANKIEIAQAIEDVYGVRPVGVNIIKMKGKFVTRGRFIGKRKDWKKAIITLPEGESIQVYEGI